MEWLTDWVPVGSLVLGVAALVWSRIPEMSRLRRLERLAAIAEKMQSDSDGARALRALVDREAVRAVKAIENGPTRALSVIAVLTVIASTVVLAITIYAPGTLSSRGLLAISAGIGLIATGIAVWRVFVGARR